ncbi:MAG: mRNA surveillance protein pelota [Candidatus Thermoplasmatota archaeon]|nr:mRNA surveillance protein pelota [Candidatus Thermoplasmatota archaeon]
MKILHQDKREGKIKIRIDNLDDLWHLKNIINPGDVVSAITFRREETQRDKIRSERGEKKKMRLDIEVEKVEFHEFTDRLRVLGVIIEGPQDHGSYHTLNLTDGDELTIIKEWKDHELDRLEEAVERSEEPMITFVALEEDDATIAIMRQYGVKEMATLSPNRGGKMYDSEQMSREDFFDEIIKKLKTIIDPGEPLVILGPGFTKEDFFEYCKRHEPELVKHAEVVPAGEGGLTGVNEVLKKGRERETLDGQRMSYETEKVEDLLREIKSDGAYSYGFEEVKRAVNIGAVNTLLILDTKVREEEGEKLMEETEDLGGEVIVISNTHEGGEKLEALGGVGALLRYKIE